jgi:opacity protein-like surface antigen
MKAKLTTCLTLGCAMMAGLSSEAFAGGDYYPGSGSVKDYGGTPVPAPIPVPTYDPVWYFRLDVGLGFGTAPSASEKGMVFGEPTTTYAADHTFGPHGSAMSSDYDDAVTFAAGVGYRLNDRFRMDLTAESVREQTHKLIDTSRAGLLDPVASIPGSIVTSTDDRLSTRGGAILLNAYYDMPTEWHSFTPYVGAGLGFAMLSVDRKNSTVETAYDTGVPTTATQFSSHDSSSENAMSFAAMATVGASYRLSDITELDLNYRYLYIDGVDASVKVNGHSSNVETGGASDHALRAGLRFNIQ